MTRTPPTPSPLDQHLGYWLRYVSNHVSHAFMQKLAAQGVTVAEWVVLREMWQKEPLAPHQLANDLGLTRGAVSKLTERLHRKALLQRTSLPNDRRCQQICLTAKGKKLVPYLAQLADQNDEEFFGHITARQQTQLIGLLRDIVQRHDWKEIPTV